ncbi:MAG: hydantoinase/oxoprolinase family protein [Arenicellales bacterium]|jgi:N-methylhydantoinase A|nr:hydantoinase/oxoprolinase family protein [Arenicellales bacterium]
MARSWKVGIDIGGTFTDVIAVNTEDGAVRTAKVQSRSSDPVASIASAYRAVGIAWVDVSDLMHGTTMATNAIVEDRLAPVALIATEGFRDTLEIGRQNRRELYRLEVTPKLPPLVPTAHRLEVTERIDAEGRVLTPLNDTEIERVTKATEDLGVPAVAVALQQCFANTEHEARLGRRLQTAVPYVALSHRISPEPREFERTNTTVLNAALMPLTAGYLDKLEQTADGSTNLHLFHSAGGMSSIEAVKDRPLALALSGPAAGVAAAGRIAEELGLTQAIGFDMGGTTTDTCVVIDGKVQIDGNQRLAERPVRQLMVAVESIGAGGGSIARIQGQAIRVGPDSAGADPGPACYGFGGERPTVADANLVLGYLNSERLLGDSIRLDPQLALAATRKIADAFNVSDQEMALGIYRIANANMARALRRVAVERGIDARACTLIAFGGAGPMHAVALAREFGIAHVVVPKFSSVFSALGCLMAELSYAEQHAIQMSSTAWQADGIERLCRQMYDRLVLPLTAAGHAPDSLLAQHIALIRYAGQSDTVEVPFTPPADRDALSAEFKAKHKQLYGFVTDEPWELETLRLTLSAPAGNEIKVPTAAMASASTPSVDSTCWFDSNTPIATPRYDRTSLAIEQKIKGPAIIEDQWSTTVVPPGATAWADATGHIHIDTGRPV